MTSMGDPSARFITTNSTTANWNWGVEEIAGTGYVTSGHWPLLPFTPGPEPEKEKLMTLGTRTFPNISKEEAATQLALYESLPELTEHEKTLMAVYDAIVAETKFVDLSVLFQPSQNWTPKLAIAPVSATEVVFKRTIHIRLSALVAGFPRDTWRSSFKVGSWSLDHSGQVSGGGAADEVELHSKVPSVIPTERDKVQDGDLIVWEATWKETYRREVIQQRPDPMVIRRITGDIYKVIAAWDLTPVEAALLTQ